MSEKKRVITRKGKKPIKREFNFTEEMIPSFANGQPEPGFLFDYRKKAWNSFSSKELPSTLEEPWRRTDIKKLAVNQFQIEKQTQYPEISPEILQPFGFKEFGGKVVLYPDKTETFLKGQIADKGVIFTDFRTAAQKYPDVLEKILGSVVDVTTDKFSSMAGAFAENGVLLYVPKGVRVELPLHSIYWGSGSSQAHFSHLLIYLEENADITYLHEYATPNEKEQSLHAGIVEVHVGKNANLRFIEIQNWGENVWNFSHEKAVVDRDGNLDWVLAAMGSRLTKNFTDIDLVGQGAVGRMAGIYFTDQSQHLDHDTQQNHLAPNTISDLLFKGALKDHSRSVWQGMIYVSPEAQKTDGFQSNPNLILDMNARADSIPGLEILADDVRCTHGATVGKINQDEVFYFNSRGISTEEAEKLIVMGFFDPVISRIPFETLRERLEKLLVDKLN